MTAIQEAIDRAFGKSGYSSAWEPTGDAQLLATEVRRLQDLHRPRDTRKGEWPEHKQKVLEFDTNAWWPETYEAGEQVRCHLWLPAPPSPEDT